MQQLIDYAQHHPFLLALAVALGIAVLVYELRASGHAMAAISAGEAVRMMNNGALVIDVRSKEEFASGHIGEARNLAVGELEAQADTLKKWRDKPIIAYCESGARSAAAVSALSKLGFSHVFNLAGGIQQWRRDNMPVVKGS